MVLWDKVDRLHRWSSRRRDRLGVVDGHWLMVDDGGVRSGLGNVNVVDMLDDWLLVMDIGNNGVDWCGADGVCGCDGVAEDFDGAGWELVGLAVAELSEDV